MLIVQSDKTLVEVGVDEAGRGPLAFDVVSAAVVMPTTFDPNDKYVNMIKDSKKLSAKKRDILAEYIKSTALAYGIGIATVDEIDKHNILNATYLAMHRAIDEVDKKLHIDLIKVDGDRFKAYLSKTQGRWLQHECCVDGDSTHLNIAAASILAKTYRDHEIEAIVANEPELDNKYGFKKNKGYGTPQHMKGLAEHGICKYHRQSYAPVRNAIK